MKKARTGWCGQIVTDALYKVDTASDLALHFHLL